jgi:hypothetical protein
MIALGALIASLILLALVEHRYRRGTYGPLQEVGMLVSICGCCASLGALARLAGL